PDGAIHWIPFREVVTHHPHSVNGVQEREEAKAAPRGEGGGADVPEALAAEVPRGLAQPALLGRSARAYHALRRGPSGLAPRVRGEGDRWRGRRQGDDQEKPDCVLHGMDSLPGGHHWVMRTWRHITTAAARPRPVVAAATASAQPARRSRWGTVSGPGPPRSACKGPAAKARARSTTAAALNAVRAILRVIEFTSFRERGLGFVSRRPGPQGRGPTPRARPTSHQLTSRPSSHTASVSAKGAASPRPVPRRWIAAVAMSRATHSRPKDPNAARKPERGASPWRAPSPMNPSSA